MSDFVSAAAPPHAGVSAASELADDTMPAERFALGCVVLCGFAIITCLAGLRGGPVMGDHEAIVAQAARQCRQSGEWLIPYLGEIPRIRKTPIGIWAAGASSYVFGDPAGLPVTAYSARVPSAIAGVLNAMFVCWLGRMLYGRRAGLVAGFVAAGCVATLMFARNAQVDMILTMFTTLSFALFWRGAMHERPSRWAMIGFYVAFAAAMMAKAPLPGVTVGVALAVFWLLTLPLVEAGGVGHNAARQFFRIGQLWFVPGIILFVVLAASWPVYAFLSVDNALALWKVEYAARFSGDMSPDGEPFWYFVPVVFVLTAPYLLSLPEAAAAVFLPRYRAHRRQLAYAFTWAMVGTFFISLSSYKRQHYVLSMIPAYCLLLAPVIDRLFFGRLWASARTVRVLCHVAPLALAAGAVVGGVILYRRDPSFTVPYIVIAVLVVVMWSLASLVFAAGRRGFAFGLLSLGVTTGITLGYPAAGARLELEPEIQALIRNLEKHGIGREEPLYWVGGRPNSTIEFYSGYRVRRLINELEMTEIRSDRRTVDEETYREFARRIREKLAEPHPVYLVMASGHYELMRRQTDIRAAVVFELTGFHEMPGDDLVLITQPDIAGTQPAK